MRKSVIFSVGTFKSLSRALSYLAFERYSVRSDFGHYVVEGKNALTLREFVYIGIPLVEDYLITRRRKRRTVRLSV